jgi:hypothetical protein
VQGDDAAAGRVDDSRNLVADHGRRRRRVGIQAEAGEDVGEIHAGGADANPHVAVGRRWHRRLPDFQDAGGAMPWNDDLPHRAAG